MDLNREEACQAAKPLVVQAIISGPDMVDIAYLYLKIMTGNEIENNLIEPKYLDFMPRKKPKAVEQLNINDFIFNNTLKIRSAIDEEAEWEYEMIPFVTTNINGDRHYGQGIVFNENLQDYLLILKEIIDQEHYHKYGDLVYIDRKSIEYLNIDEDILDYARVEFDLPIGTKGDTSDKYNVFLLIQDYIDQLYLKVEEKSQIFNGKRYFVPKAISILSECAIFSELSYILSSIYLK